MKILVSGATGFIGQSLTKKLLNDSHEVFAYVRKVDNRLDKKIHQLTLPLLSEINEQFDVFINLAGENIAGKAWSEKRKKALYDSRVTLTDNIKNALNQPPKLVISMSAVGFYGLSINDIFYEDTPPSSGFAHKLCAAWEQSAKAFLNDGARVVIFRLGVVLGKGGALAKMRLPFKCGAGGPIAGGKQWFSWVHIDDVIKAIDEAIQDKSFSGVYNLVSPQIVQQGQFARLYANSLNRPAILPTPRWLLSIIFGEMASLLTEGPKIIPKRLIDQNFCFKYKQLDSALKAVEKSY
ncbi:TIGR01777 family protein [Marinomonas sp. CT5]|nr:TIGR01777 family protein [Marinomonas sp. CT5]